MPPTQDGGGLGETNQRPLELVACYHHHFVLTTLRNSDAGLLIHAVNKGPRLTLHI